MAKLHTSYSHIEHASTCPCALSRDEDCNCFYSALAKTSIFHAATAQGPGGPLGVLDEFARSDVDNFINQKRIEYDAITPRVISAELYEPLLKGQIRALELLPGQPGAPLRGKLHIVNIDFAHVSREQTFSKTATWTRQTNHAISLTTAQPLWYTALSYVWGAPVFDQTITFEQGSLNITSSLASALQRLRLTEHSVFLWIDQICINQPDMAEKVQQIPLMGLIYTHATNTFIWLGDDDGSDPFLAFDTMETVFARLQGSEAHVTTEDFKGLAFPPATDRAWWTIRQLLRRPWLTRLWTIQEAVLSRNLFVGCGNAVACWDDFAIWCYHLQESGILQWLTAENSLDDEYSEISSVGILSEGQSFKATPFSMFEDKRPLLRPPIGAAVVESIQADRVHGLTMVAKDYLLHALVSTRYAEATNLKDKIYGVLGMAESNIIPDYTNRVSVRDVYQQACITQLPQLAYELLSCIDHDDPLTPSWVPDWSVPRVTEVFGYLTKAQALYCAGGRPIYKQPLRVMLSDDNGRLAVSGKMFDTVVHLGCVAQNPLLNTDDPQARNWELASYVDLVLASTNDHDYPLAGISTYDAFLQTLVAGRDGTGVLPPSPDHSEVFSLVLDSITGKMPSLPGQKYSPRRQKGHFTLNNLKSRKPARTFEDLGAAIRAALKMRRFAITSKGYFALVPRGAKQGDVVAVFDRACVPFVIRRVKRHAIEIGYELLGEAYVHGIMKGEVMTMDDIGLEDITLV